LSEKIKKARKPMSKGAKIAFNLLVTLVVGLLVFYFSLPALNIHSGDLYRFIILLMIVYIVTAILSSGYRPASQGLDGVREYLKFLKAQFLPILAALVAILLVVLIGQLTSLPIFRASSYRELLDVREGNFAEEVTQISFNEIPTLDQQSADYLGDRQMGSLSDMVSQFEYSFDSTQINYQGRPVRVAPISYADLIKWFTNRSEGLPAYVIVDMVTQEATVVRLPEGMKYSNSEPLNRNVLRHLRFTYPTMIFARPEFEIDEEGNPWWIAPHVVKRIGLFGGMDVDGAVLMNAVTGECTYYAAEDVPTWVDNLYPANLFAQQYDYYGTLVHGFINSIFGQRDVKQVTSGNNYIAMNDDVYMYTGVTSANSDRSNLGFLLCNMRTKESTYYTAYGATEAAAMTSAQGQVQDQGYIATFPLLLNISGQPTYFIPLMDNSMLVKMYAMVNVSQSQIVATGTTVTSTEAEYIRKLGETNLQLDEDRPQTSVSGPIAEIRPAVLDGNTIYFIRLEGDPTFYSIKAKDNNLAVILNVGDTVTIEHASTSAEESLILEGYTVTLDKAAPVTDPTSVVIPGDIIPSPAPTQEPAPAVSTQPTA